MDKKKNIFRIALLCCVLMMGLGLNINTNTAQALTQKQVKVKTTGLAGGLLCPYKGLFPA
ncbi:MAG: hypothetical protein HFH72_05485 [Lachnospiraceae bacterium]|nr:hypothetical protein [Lachnospiraceae bacterium]